MIGKPEEQPQALNDEDQKRLIAVVRRYKDQWSQVRRQIMERCLENMEFFKGNHFTSFNPDSFQFFDGISALNTQHEDGVDDRDLYQFTNNFYQMLCTAFVAAMSPQLPKSVWLPADADNLQDVTTAKVAQILIDIIERKNQEKAKLKQQLLYMFMCGCYFRHTRYIIDGDRAGTRKEPVYDYTETELSPDRYVCQHCGQVTPANTAATMLSPHCQTCGQPLDQSGFFPAETGTALAQVGEEEVPDGMVAQTVYSPLEVDADPAAKELRQTPILNLDVEVHISSLRASYPSMYDDIQTGAESQLSDSAGIDRIYRQTVYSQADGGTRILGDDRPTLSRTWIQPYALDIDGDKEWAKKMRATFPKGILLVNAGAKFLEAREAQMMKEWTWAGAHEGFGLFPPCPGDVVIPFNKRFNDISNMIHEFMDRSSAGLTLANADLINTQSLNGKPLLPGVLNPVKLKGASSATGKSLADALFQFKFELDQAAFSYGDKLLYLGQMMAGVPPQIYGGSGDPSIETKGGQEQQLNVALGKLNIYWDSIRDEHSAADQIAVECAQNNLTDDIKQVIAEQGSEFRNQVVPLNDLQGEAHSHPDEDQGFPMTPGELRQRWQTLVDGAEKNPVIAALFDDPTNQVQAATALGMPGLVVPGEAMSSKVLQIIAQLLKAEPIPDQNNQAMPTILPDKDIDDFEKTRAVIRQYCQKNFDLARTNPGGFANVLAYLKVAVQMATQESLEAAQRQASVQQAGQPQPPAPPQPPQPNPQVMQEGVAVVDRLKQLSMMPPTQTNNNIQGQVAAAQAEAKILGAGK